jgi:hypothetical protein
MKATIFVTAAVAGVLSIAADRAAAQREEPRRDPPTPVRIEIPAGMTFNFSDIDRNNDGNISVEEWNAFVASLQSRLGQKPAGAAAAGGTGAEKQQPRPQR